MNKKHTLIRLLFLGLVILSSVITSCKKHTEDTPVAPLAKLGLYGLSQDIYKRIFIPIAQVGTVSTTAYPSIFDTGSTGMTIDADGLIPATMITTNGITFTGDSVVVNGITITNKTSVMAYGDALSSTKEYGYLAYASMSFGTGSNTVTAKRVPFFLYYKIVDGNGNVLAKHYSDVFGVGPGSSYASTLIASPLSYLTMPSGVTNGFKLAQLSSSGFSTTGTYVSGLLTLGLIPSDLDGTAGFTMHPLISSGTTGYSANIYSTITYGTKTTTGYVLFDTGTPAYTVIEDITATAIGTQAANTVVTVVTDKGFKYSYTTSNTSNLTQVQNPNNTKDYRTIFSLSFFLDNEYLTDYTNHKIGLKNN